MVTVFRRRAWRCSYVEARDGHNWENWRDRLRDGLAWLHPGRRRSSSTSEDAQRKRLSIEKVVERWRSDRMQQDITLARWGHFGVPVLVFPTAGGDAEEVERHHLVGHLGGLIEDGRIKVYSCDSVAGQAMTADDGDAGVPLLAVQPVPAGDRPRGGAGDPRRHRRPEGRDRRRRLDRRVQRAGAGLPLPRPVPGRDLHERDLRHRAVHRRLHRRPVTSPRRCTSCPGSRVRRSTRCASGSWCWPPARASGRTPASPGALPTCSATKGVPNRVDDWGPDYDHDWPTWWQMLPEYLEQLT